MNSPHVYDVCIVGGGPSGATCAFDLARANKTVLVLEKKTFPRDKLCGDAVCLPAHAHLERMGVLGELEAEGKVQWAEIGGFVSPRGIGFIGNSARPNRRPLVVAIKREWLDEKMIRAAVRAGAELRDGHTVLGATRIDDVWTVRLSNRQREQQTVHARALVAADGALSRLTEVLGMPTPPPDGICSRAYVKAGTHAFDADGVCFYRLDMVPGYAALFREADGDVSFCCYIIPGGAKGIDDLRELHDRFLREPHIAAALGPRAVIDKMRAAPLRLGGRRRTHSEGLLIIGDAAGHIDPLTGEGIHLAIEGATIAARTLNEALAEDDLSAASLARYDRRWRRAFGWDFRISTALAKVYTRFPFFIDASALAMQRRGVDALLEWARLMTGASPKLQFLRPRIVLPILLEAARAGARIARGHALERIVLVAREHTIDRWHETPSAPSREAKKQARRASATALPAP